MRQGTTTTDVGIPNVENKSSSTIRGEITVNAQSGVLQGIGTASIAVNNSKTTKAQVGLTNVDDLSAASIRQGTTKADVGLSNVEDKSSSTIRGEITVNAQSGVLQGIGTASIAVNNSKTTKAQVGLTNVDDLSAATIRAGTTKADVGLTNVEDKSAATIRGEITVNAQTGVLQGIGTASIAVNNDKTTKAQVGLGDVENLSSSQINAGVITGSITSGSGAHSFTLLSATEAYPSEHTATITWKDGAGTTKATQYVRTALSTSNANATMYYHTSSSVGTNTSLATGVTSQGSTSATTSGTRFFEYSGVRIGINLTVVSMTQWTFK